MSACRSPSSSPRRRPVVGFDISERRIAALRVGTDITRELTRDELAQGRHLRFSTKAADLAECNFYIVTVPTPVDDDKQPDLGPVAFRFHHDRKGVEKGDIVVYESTVYPGATEEDCVPVLEKTSGLKFNVDFFAGYSPERINPGDKDRRVATIKKITSGSTPEVADLIDELYREIVTAGTHKAPSIKVAEAAKVIENTQRDLNIAIVNEFAHDILEAGHRHRGGFERRGHEVELPAVPPWSRRRPLHRASIPIISATRRRRSAIIPRSFWPAAG